MIEAATHYERKLHGLGHQFLDEVDRTVGLIAAAPMQWAVIEADVRRTLTRRFPYAIYYRALEDELRILAFKHHARHPNYWRYRLAST